MITHKHTHRDIQECSLVEFLPFTNLRCIASIVPIITTNIIPERKGNRESLCRPDTKISYIIFTFNFWR